MNHMSDDQFLQYCRTRSEQERCVLTHKQAARLLRLADEELLAQCHDAKPQAEFVCCDHEAVLNLVDRARMLLQPKEAA